MFYKASLLILITSCNLVQPMPLEQKLASVVPQAAICVLAVKEAVDMGRDLYAYAYPDEEKEARIEKAKKKNAIIETKRTFRSCLMENAKAPRNEVGIPTNCEVCGENFATTAGMEAFREMVETFKETY